MARSSRLESGFQDKLQKELKEAQKKNTREQIETSNKLEDIEKHINNILMESEE